MGPTGMFMMVGEWFARYVAGKVMDKMGDKALSSTSDNDNMLVDVRTMLKKVEDSLPRILAVIHAAEGKPIRSQVLVNWLRELKDAAYEADDALDEFEFRELQESQDSSKVAAFVSSARRFIKNLFVSDDELQRLKNLVGDIDEIFLDIDSKTAEVDEYIAKGKSATRETSSFMREEVFGRDKERDRILDMLLRLDDEPDFGSKGAGSSSYPSLGVLPIVGIGGVGKTALAQLVYNDSRVANHFKRKWVYVSDDFKMKRIFKELIYDSPGGVFEDNISSAAMLKKLTDDFKDKRFLIVLDDVWDETGTTWKEIRSALTFGAKRSTILLTTQSPKVAEIMGTMNPIHLEPLEEHDFRRLFELCAFGDEELKPDLKAKLQLIGQQILQKLHGLPLAGKALGSLLRTRFDEKFWNAVLESEWWEEDFAVSNILPSLGLGYQHLSTNLKQCFAYASVFPKAYVFHKERLAQMWIAQGFIQSKSQGRMSLEDIGSQIFDELADRYFFLSKQDGGYMMHDLIRELAVCVSQDECCVVNDDEPVEIPPTVRHLSLTAAKLDAVRQVHKFRKVRTIIFFHEFNPTEFYAVLEDILENIKSLRVLDLSYVHMGLKRLPDAICELSHLRYLDISHTKIRQLPKSFSRLCHLQVLNVKGCFSLYKLTQGMDRLIRLRYFYAEAGTISLINGIGKLTDLQELEIFQVARKRGHQIGELKQLRNLRRRLCIRNLENVESKEEAMEGQLKDKHQLDEVSNIWTEDREDLRGDLDMDILEGLEPPCGLKRLEIMFYGGLRCPTWLVTNHLISLVSVCLTSCKRLVSLPPLGKLPFLKNLEFKAMPALKLIGVELYENADPVFPSLEFLRFELLEGCEEWSEADSRQFLPRLRELHIYNCMKLRKAPLPHLPTSFLKLLKLWNSGDLGSDISGCLLLLTSLDFLELSDFKRRASVCLSNLSNLNVLRLIDCPELRLPGGIRSLPKLRELTIEGCPNLYEPGLQWDQPSDEQNLRSLSYFSTGGYALDNMRLMFGRIHALRTLQFWSCKHLASFTVEQEEWLQQLPSLEELEFAFCAELLSLPANLANISSMKKLEIFYCPEIKSLPESGLPLLLKELIILHCPSLSERCRKDEGADWPKIAHIPYIRTDDQEIESVASQQQEQE
ncbi:putative disease resistance protein RGA4 [Musa acuminata AAA Group]|uniref:putative disease resistance protein RGA4 n=1 Tax=Musa acuminata AAA Group TaxID=214697 RepID=UPI0031D89FC5